MCSIYIWQLVQPVAAPLVMHMHGYTGGVATVRVLSYPAWWGLFETENDLFMYEVFFITLYCIRTHSFQFLTEVLQIIILYL